MQHTTSKLALDSSSLSSILAAIETSKRNLLFIEKTTFPTIEAKKMLMVEELERMEELGQKLSQWTKAQ